MKYKDSSSAPCKQSSSDEDALVLIMHYSHLAVPSAGPIVTDVYNTSSKSIMLRWTEIPHEYRNGIVTGHRVKYLESSAVDDNAKYQEVFLPRSTDGFYKYELVNLQKHTLYNILINARTSKGDGPVRNLTTKTGPYGR